MCKNSVVAFMNMKGGVCKTTLCVNIAYTLSSFYNKKVLVIDMDPQFNATQYFFNTIYKSEFLNTYNTIKNNKKTIFNLYDNMENNDTISEFSNNNNSNSLTSMFNIKRTNNFLKENFITEIYNNLHIIVGDIRLVRLQIVQRTGIEDVLQQYIYENNLKNKYDYILIDSPPTYSSFFISSYIACDTYIVPLKPDFVASLGLSLLNKGIEEILKTNKLPKYCLGIIYTLIDNRNNVHINICKDLNRNYKEHIFEKNVGYFSSVPYGVEQGRFMVDINENEISKNIKNITEEFINRLNTLNQKEKTL